MTSTPVNVQGFVSGAMYGASHLQGTENKGDFSKIFESQKNTAGGSDDFKVKKDGGVDELNSQDDAEYKTEIKDTHKEIAAENQTEDAQKSTAVQESAESGKEQSAAYEDSRKDQLTAEEAARVAELFGNAAADVKEMLMQQLQLTEEELNALMQECNLSDMDLLELGNVKELMLRQAEAGDMTALLTNEELYIQSKGVEAAFAEIMQTVQETLNMNSEEVQALAQQIDEALSRLEGNGEDSALAEMLNGSEEDAKTQMGAVDKKGNAEQSFTQQNSLFAQQNQMMQQTESVQTTSVHMASYTTAEAENIMRQIMDYMQIRMDADTTELNMQLHPESLGTLQIRISAKEGIMTAQFTTASETVKSVLEGQMIQLQQQFEQQNIKVEAIEVTVQSHAFESALEKGKDQQGEEETKKNRTRRIDLNLLDGSQEVETEDKLLAEMMEVNGNSVDYLV